MQAMVGVEIPLLGDVRRKNWAKVVTGVDDRSGSGWAFEGSFVAAGGIQDVPVGSVVLVYGERGSRANPHIEAGLFLAHGDGTLSTVARAAGRAWARTLRDRAAELLDGDPPARAADWSEDLLRYSTQALAEELQRRGWSIEPAGSAVR